MPQAYGRGGHRGLPTKGREEEVPNEDDDQLSATAVVDPEVWRNNLKTLMEQRGLSAKELSRQANLGDTFVSDVLRRGTNPTVQNLTLLANALGTNIRALFDREDQPPGGGSLAIKMQTSGSESWRICLDDECSSVAIPELTDVVVLRVADNDLAPYYALNDVLIGKKLTSEQLLPYVGNWCITELVEGLRLIRVVHRGSAPGRFNLVSANPQREPLRDASVAWAAPVSIVLRNPQPSGRLGAKPATQDPNLPPFQRKFDRLKKSRID